ncbi:hypothetical protein JCM33374_g1287 [Metschnikowia sp. JCM 33374]|nr:hypothetical protein JCM33374_g1287 [Metschnikowia sp. JCM 33374]
MTIGGSPNTGHRNFIQQNLGYSAGTGVASAFASAETIPSTSSITNCISSSHPSSQPYQASDLQSDTFLPNPLFPSDYPPPEIIDEDTSSLAYAAQTQDTSTTAQPAGLKHIDLLDFSSDLSYSTVVNMPNSKETSAKLAEQSLCKSFKPQNHTDAFLDTQDINMTSERPHLQVPFQSSSTGVSSTGMSSTGSSVSGSSVSGSSSKPVPSKTLQSSHLPILLSQNNVTGERKNNKECPGALKTPQPSEHCQIMQEVDEAFAKFGPLLRTVNANNVSAFLVEFLKTYHRHIPLENLFSLLYYANVLDSESVSTAKFSNTEPSESIEPKLTAIRFCRIILVKLQTPPPSIGPGAASDPQSSSINYHELLRTFLAIKIIFSTIKKVEGSASSRSTLLRLSVYKVYYIICQKLIQKSSNISNCADESIILGQSKLGKLTNLVFPNSITKRLGKRGQSKYHYIGFVWDPSNVSQETLKLSELEIPQLRAHFKKSGKGNIQKRNTHSSPNMSQKNQARRSLETSLNVHPLPAYTKPLHTFADICCTFPDTDCSPRLWTTTPNSIPQQSKWAQAHMERSLMILKAHNVDLNPLVHNFTSGCFAADNHESLSKTILQAMTTLEEASAPKEAYLHVYFVILVMIFPVVMASDTEVDISSKNDFRTTVKHCVAKLDCETTNLPCIDEISLTIFVGVLKKMLRFSELTSCKIKVPYNEVVFTEMMGHLDTALTVTKTDFGFRSPLEAIYTRSIVMSMNSYTFKLVEDSTADKSQLVGTIADLACAFKDTAMNSKTDMQVMLENAKTQGSQPVFQDVSYQAVKISIQNFHEMTLRGHWSRNFPWR